MKKIIFTEEEEEEIINLYLQEQKSLREIGEKFNCSRSVIVKVIDKHEIPKRIKTNKYKADYDKFEKIDSDEKAYWLGFIAADGCVYTREINASVLINLSRKDRDHIEKFKFFMNSNAKIKDFIQTEGFSNNSQMSKIVLNSKKMAQDLINKGIVSKKSLILKPPLIEEKYYNSFIMGYFDGDGSIYKTKQGEWGVSIEGTREMLEWINSISFFSTLHQRNPDSDKNNYYISCGGLQRPYNTIKQFYESSPEHLTRKFEKFKVLETVVLSRNIKEN